MGLFSFKSTKKYPIPSGDMDKIVAAIQKAEQTTSGEIRIYVESHCKYVDPLERAAEIFWSLKMDHTIDRNGVLIYIAMKDHQFAIFGDKGIYEKLGREFWQNEVDMMSVHFKENHYIDAIQLVIHDIGLALQEHFPYEREIDRNELPDDIIFGN